MDTAVTHPRRVSGVLGSALAAAHACHRIVRVPPQRRARLSRGGIVSVYLHRDGNRPLETRTSVASEDVTWWERVRKTCADFGVPAVKRFAR